MVDTITTYDEDYNIDFVEYYDELGLKCHAIRFDCEDTGYYIVETDDRIELFLAGRKDSLMVSTKVERHVASYWSHAVDYCRKALLKFDENGDFVKIDEDEVREWPGWPVRDENDETPTISLGIGDKLENGRIVRASECTK